MEPVNILDSVTGINMKVDPHDNAPNDLAEAVNVIINDAGKIQLAPGNIKLKDLTNGHSGFCEDDYICLVCQGTNLYRLQYDFDTLVGLRSGMSGDYLDYVQFGNAVYYCNGSEVGVVQDWTSWEWQVDTYTGAPTTIKWEETIPAFNHIELFSGRMLGSIDNILYWSEIDQFGLFSKEHFVGFGSDIIMMKAVGTGLFVSDKKGQYFLSGFNPFTWTLNQVAEYPALEWSDRIKMPDGMAIKLEVPELCGLWLSSEGPCLGMPSGKLVNLTIDKIIYPEASAGAVMLYGNHLIQSLR